MAKESIIERLKRLSKISPTEESEREEFYRYNRSPFLWKVHKWREWRDDIEREK